MAKPPGKRGLTDEDRRLWKQVTDTVTPREPLRLADQQGFVSKMKRTVSSPVKKSTLKTTVHAAYHPPMSEPQVRSMGSSLSPLDRREKSKIAKGRVEIDGKLDLHGLTQDQAYKKVHHFVLKAYSKGWRTLLIITGKGKSLENSRKVDIGVSEREIYGVLRQRLPSWLQNPDLRSIVLSCDEAVPKHGGSGAFYVRLRRNASFSQ